MESINSRFLSSSGVLVPIQKMDFPVCFLGGYQALARKHLHLRPGTSSSGGEERTDISDLLYSIRISIQCVFNTLTSKG
jgi:hypothetical protein